MIILQVLQRYYTQYLCGYDAIALNQLIQEQQGLPEEESVILSSMCNEIGSLSVKQGEVYGQLVLRVLSSRISVRGWGGMKLKFMSVAFIPLMAFFFMYRYMINPFGYL